MEPLLPTADQWNIGSGDPTKDNLGKETDLTPRRN
jgi:hypothetical protein